MKNVKKHMIFLLTVLLSAVLVSPVQAQEIRLDNGVTIDKAVHNFGDIMMSDGPVEATFTVTNKSKKAIVIYNVVTSCGCTEAKWTRKPVKPGETGTITVTYTNDEGPYAFNKSVTVYLSEVKRPVILRIKGKSHEKKFALEDTYRLRFGPLGVERNTVTCGNMLQGQMRSNVEMVANLSDRPIRIDFTDISDDLEIKVQPNPIPARSTARLHFCITSSPERWGNNDYHAVPVVDGTPQKGSNGETGLIFQAFTIEDFSKATITDKKVGPKLEMEMSAFECGKIRKGEPIKAIFDISNAGGKNLKIYKVDSDANGFKHNTVPILRPGEHFTLTAEFDTCCVPEGEFLALVTLTTNSPSRPYANLFVSATIEY